MKITLRCLSLALALLLAVSSALAASFRTQVSNVLKEWEENDVLCETVEWQKANGAVCSAKLLSIICDEVDDGSMTKSIQTVNATFETESAAANSALKTQANGLYRSVEYLYLFAHALDTANTWRKSIETVWDNYVSGDAAARSTKGMATQALDCIAELSYIIACLCDTAGTYAADIDRVWEEYQSDVGKGSLTAQMVNSSSAAVGFMYIADRAMDGNNRYRTRTNQIMESYDTLAASASTQDQMIANALYRFVELLGVMGHQLAAGK
ncbi:MAG: hypothetical protein IKI84_08530 [Clostridia bacterium]|nr:hypothetical protein [Clostridia bacterium]